MGLLEALRGKRAKEHQEITDGYWPLMNGATAADKVDARTTAAIDAAAKALGKSIDDVAKDAELLGNLNGLGDLDALAADVEAQARQLRDQAAAKSAEAGAARARADRLQAEAEDDRRRIHHLHQSLDLKRSTRAQLVRELALRGYTPAEAEITRRGLETDLHQVRIDLAAAEQGIERARELIGDRQPDQVPHVMRHLDGHQRERARLLARERDLLRQLKD